MKSESECKIFNHDNATENIGCEMAAILSRMRWVIRVVDIVVTRYPVRIGYNSTRLYFPQLNRKPFISLLNWMVTLLKPCVCSSTSPSKDKMIIEKANTEIQQKSKLVPCGLQEALTKIKRLSFDYWIGWKRYRLFSTKRSYAPKETLIEICIF